jgi:CBS domain-containing protein
VRALQAAKGPVRTVPAGSTLTDVAEVMADEGLRVLVVVDQDGLPVGIVTERDVVVRGLARGRRPSSPVEVVMTPEVVTAGASAPARTVFRLLQERRIRQVPLIEQGGMVAMLYRDDLGDERTAEILAGLRTCPHCAREWLRPVETGDSTNFLCLYCRSCWSVAGATLAPVETRRCRGCEEHNLCRPPLVDFGVAPRTS